MRKPIFIIKLAKDEYIHSDIKHFKIPFTHYYITKGYPCIFSENRFYDVFECGRKYGFIHTVGSWW